MTIETKARLDADTKTAMADLLYTFEAFKEANDQRLAEIEGKTAADAVTTEKLARIDQALIQQKSALDRLAAQAGRPALDGRAEPVSERKSAFDGYLRSGTLAAPEAKAIAASDSDGGVIAPEETARLIDQGLRALSPMRQIATVRQISSNTYRKPYATTPFGAGWVGESAARTQTTTPSLSPLDFPAMELYAMPATTQTLLDDAVVDVSQWIADEVRAEFAAQETAAFVTGNGTTQPAGFMTYPTAADAGRSATQIGKIGSAASSVTGDDLIDLIYTLPQSYRANGRFVMNRTTASAVRKLKGDDGHYLWSPGVTAGQPSTLMGFPVTELEEMEDIGNGNQPIAFGDFARGYLIVDRAGIQVLRDPFSAKPYVLFYTTKRVGGGVQDFAAIKVLEMSA